MTSQFSLSDDTVALPRGAWARTERRTLRYGQKRIFSLTQGIFRSYLFPLYTPAGFLVTSESPADHPHHNSFWMASDHIHCWMPAAHGKLEEYTYHLYGNEVFQGRAPGRIVQVGIAGQQTGDASYRVVLDIEWRGPTEWAAPEGRVAVHETRTLDLSMDDKAYTIDVNSTLTPGDWELVTLGPTRHAYFNVRLAESVAVIAGGTLRDDRGNRTGDTVTGSGAKWVDYSGPVGGGNLAGIAVFPDPRDHDDMHWFVSDWGVVTVGPFRMMRRDLRKGEKTSLRYRAIVHDGSADDVKIADRYAAYLANLP